MKGFQTLIMVAFHRLQSFNLSVCCEKGMEKRGSGYRKAFGQFSSNKTLSSMWCFHAKKWTLHQMINVVFVVLTTKLLFLILAKFLWVLWNSDIWKNRGKCCHINRRKRRWRRRKQNRNPFSLARSDIGLSTVIGDPCLSSFNNELCGTT